MGKTLSERVEDVGKQSEVSGRGWGMGRISRENWEERGTGKNGSLKLFGNYGHYV
jgi:hypothetical protein